MTRRVVLLAGLLGLAMGVAPARAAVSDAEWAAALANYLELWKAKDERAAVERLAVTDDVRAAKELWGILLRLRRTPGFEATIADGIARGTDAATIAYVAGLVSDKSVRLDLRWLLTKALGAARPPRHADALVALLEDKAPTLRVLALDALGEMTHALDPRAMTKALGAPEWQVRAAAIRAMVRTMDVRAIEPMIDRLGTESGRLEVELGRALRVMTGQSLDAAADWRAWWSTHRTEPLTGPGFTAWNDPARADLAWKPVVTGTSRVPVYHGIKLYSKRLVFCMPTSSKMAEEWRGKPPVPTETLTCTSPPGTRTARLDWSKVKTLWDLARENLVFTLRQLPPSAEFTMVFYNDKVVVWRPKLVKATAANVAQAIAHLDGVTLGMSSNVHGALQKAFQIGGPHGADGDNPIDPRIVDASYAEGGDTILFASIGWATAGKIVWKLPGDKAENDEWASQLLEEVAGWNAHRGVHIHTIGVENRSDFMTQLAEAHGGLAVFRGAAGD